MPHTQGPYKIHWNMGQHGEHHNIVPADREDFGRIAFVEAFAPTDGDMQGEGLFNAHLFAASWDILKALVRLSKAADGIDIDDKPEAWAELFAAQEDAAAAIARATP